MTLEESSGEPATEYHWRETYFVLFKASDRPTLTQVEEVLRNLGDKLILEDFKANKEGQFESVRVVSPEDYAAIEINYECGEGVVEQSSALAKELQTEASSDQLTRLFSSDARLDIMHFEQVVNSSPMLEDDSLDEMLDPTSLLMIVDSLVSLSGGIAIDPASGEILP